MQIECLVLGHLFSLGWNEVYDGTTWLDPGERGGLHMYYPDESTMGPYIRQEDSQSKDNTYGEQGRFYTVALHISSSP
jgi:hypothetical protein